MEQQEMEMQRADRLGLGKGVVFVVGAFRSGTTLLRKVLDSHTRVWAPAETWFLLPLLNLWDGGGSTPNYNPKQAAAAIRGHLDQGAFIECVRAFAGRFYDAAMPAGAEVFVDKTPLYLQLAPALASVFPQAKFIVLARDPRGICWSRHTWKHASSTDPANEIAGVAQDCQRLASFYEAFGERSTLVRYEDLCLEPTTTIEGLCKDLGLGFEPAMVAYGRASHHEGYGDENTREHDRPHEQSVARWASGLDAALGGELLERCGVGVLETLGYAGAMAQAAGRADA